MIVGVLLVVSCGSSSDAAAKRVGPSPATTADDTLPPASAATAAPTVAPPIATATREPTPEPTPRPVRTGVDAYRGLGAWVDVFDWAPAYAGADGPPVTPVDLAEMADLGVTTLYFQTSRIDDVGEGAIESPELVGDFLRAAHDADIAVVGWYLPKWEDADLDLDRLVAIAEFDRDGQRFDGVAVDIEGVPEVEQRADWNRRLIALSQDLRAAVGDVALGAIVLPPTLIEEVNPEYWPNFPWAELAPLYDVWLPMSYWSFRGDDSPFSGGYAYNTDATQRLRFNLGDEQALVHAIGGIGAARDPDGDGEPIAGIDELDNFVQSLFDTDAIGGSIYDWASQEPEGREAMTNSMTANGFVTND